MTEPCRASPRRSDGRDRAHIGFDVSRGRVDMATPYLRDILRFIGVHSVRFVAVGPTVGPRDQVDAAREAAQRQLSELAALF